MKIWVPLVGRRDDLPLDRKWWHTLAQVGAVLSTYLVVAIASTAYQARPLEITPGNTFSLSLLSFARGRPGTTTLADLGGLSALGQVSADGTLVPLSPVPGEVEDVRCATPAQFKPGQSFEYAGPRPSSPKRTYRAIDDTPNQPPEQLRHCAATAGYTAYTADRIVAYQVNASARRVLGARGLLVGLALAPFWVVLYWNVYYRALVPIYARRRRKRAERRHRALSRT